MRDPGTKPEMQYTSLDAASAIAVTRRKSSGTHSENLLRGAFSHLAVPGVLQPIAQFILAESPLTADLDRRDVPALRPKADRARGDSQTPGHRGGSQ